MPPDRLTSKEVAEKVARALHDDLAVTDAGAVIELVLRRYEHDLLAHAVRGVDEGREQ